MANTLKLLRVMVAGTAITLLTACGGGSSGSTAVVTTYDVTATAGSGGSISPATATVDAGGTTKFTVAPSSGYAVSGVTGCGGTLSGNTYTTGTVNANCTVTASFVAQYSLTTAAGPHGSISPASATVNAGGTTTFKIAPDTGYAASATGCGGTLSGTTYTTGTISADCTVTASFAAAFTWVGGPSTIGKASYGTKGVAAATNMPGPRDESATWTDSSGNFWLFGGEGNDSTGTWGQLNDLWEYSPSSGEWTWVGGSDTAYTKGVYGTQGVAAPTNMPGARRSAVSWVDTSGNVWLFGGYGADSTNTFLYFNDLWKYSPSRNEWTWVGGATTVGAKGVYGTRGVAAAANVPGARANLSGWTDANGNFWLFGGEGVDSTGALGWLNDVWEYSPSSGEWTWIDGSNQVSAVGVCGSQGVAAPSNMPGARGYAATWTDASGNLWLFGGEGWDCVGGGRFLSDLWEYSPSSNEWTWVGGSNTANATANYGTQGVAAATNAPGARDIPDTWMDAAGDLWMFGGYGLDSTGAGGDLNELWEYSPSSGEWTWVAGSNIGKAKGVYGTQGIAATTNLPGARDSSLVWTAGGLVWLFGGGGYDSADTWSPLNDFWTYPIK
jgi:N-acetylneuraminic acid mutarotase